MNIRATEPTTSEQPAERGRRGRRTGVAISVPVGAFLTFDVVGKLAGFQQVKEGTAALGVAGLTR